MGLPLPSALPPRRRYVYDPSVRLMSNVLGSWADSLDHLVHLLVAFVLALPIGWNRARTGTQRRSSYIPTGCDGQLRPRADRDLRPRTRCAESREYPAGVSSLASASSVRVPSLDRVTSRPAMPPRPAFG